MQKRKLSFKEQKELEALDSEIPTLEKEKTEIEQQLSSGLLQSETIVEISKRHAELISLIDEKTMRWLELSDI